MGIIYKGLTFDGVNSLDYGIYITGEGVYNAPTRDVELITVAGRNGDFALDKGRFNNISIVYKAGSFAKTQTEFAEKISDFRNAILSKVGYKRLEDDYHTDEYRMAVYMNGLELEPVHYSEAGEFELTFNCKPQRFLKSGETEISVDSGDELTNPTLFESQPILLVDGYGDIDIDGQSISIESSPIGNVDIASTWNSPQGQSATYTPNLSALNTGDSFFVNVPSFKIWLYGGSIARDNSLSATSSVSYWEVLPSWGNVQGQDAIYVECNCTNPSLEFTKGTDYEYTTALTITTELLNITVGLKVRYASGNIAFSTTTSETYLMQAIFNRIYGISSKSALGSPIYIDCEIGEAYKIEDGEVISVNNAVLLPADLPTLTTGNNTITFDNTITDLKVVARWWKI